MKLEELKKEWEREKAVLDGLIASKADDKLIKEQRTFVKRLYDQYRNCSVAKKLEVPVHLFNLLVVDKCTYKQQEWLLYYSMNSGNVVEACDRANVKLRDYHKWMEANRESDVCFKLAKEDVDNAITDIAEAKLKDMAASNNSAVVMFYLKNRHRDYKTTVKALRDEAAERDKKGLDFQGMKSSKKAKILQTKLGVISETERGSLDKVDPTQAYEK